MDGSVIKKKIQFYLELKDISLNKEWVQAEIDKLNRIYEAGLFSRASINHVNAGCAMLNMWFMYVWKTESGFPDFERN